MEYEPRKCVICKKEFVPKSPNHLYCSRECSNEGKSMKRAARKGLILRIHDPKKVGNSCVCCGREFSSHKSKKFCSQDCVEKYYAQFPEYRTFENKNEHLDEEIKRANESGLSYGYFKAAAYLAANKIDISSYEGCKR